MKKKVFLAVLGVSLAVYACTKDPIVTDPTEGPNTEKPTDPTDPTGPTDPTEPTEPTKPGSYVIPADQKAYYSTIDFSKLSGMELKEKLADLTTTKHVNSLGYTTKLWEALKITDATPDGKSVYLIYGTKGTTQGTQAYTRDKNKHGGDKGEWNREHVYARALGTPNLKDNYSANSDLHHLRPADVEWNNKRDNLKFVKGNGNSGSVSGGWYPGDEWKGDVARMMMYMYIRYGDQCKPSGVAIGSANKVDPKMIDLLLEWNATDEVSPLEIQRNEYLGKASNPYGQGNRNPFIDNPHLATAIWGGPEAQNRWK
ncbi:endonuclease [Myroides pelagicus]|uniref:endonuclease I family protein n=1 Tax=Myroides pelagicus TaxID=270914 RepID=UPI002DB648A8|nr:endonuclease [Myroides pelagicus]MEC4114987.1 endonuclease [Myroides pelagicus]